MSFNQEANNQILNPPLTLSPPESPPSNFNANLFKINGSSPPNLRLPINSLRNITILPQNIPNNTKLTGVVRKIKIQPKPYTKNAKLPTQNSIVLNAQEFANISKVLY